LLLLRLPRLEIVREPREDVGEAAGFRRHRHEGPVELGERSRPLRERARQGLAGTHLRSRFREEPGGARVVGLLRDGQQRLVERHARSHEGCQLSRRQCDL
jgi:hypothetical protein